MTWPGSKFVTNAIKYKSAGFYAAAHSASQFATMVSQFVALKFIAPEYIGAWQSVMVINTYLGITQFGVINAMNREYPHLYASGDREAARGLMQSAQAYNMFNGLLVGVLFIVLMFWRWHDGWMWRWSYSVMALTAIVSLVASFLQSMYRCAGEFTRLSWLDLLHVPFCGLIPLGAAWFGFPGYCLGFLLTACVTTAGLFLFRPLRFPFGCSGESLKLLLSTGWRLHIRNYLMRINKAMPRTALGSLGGAAALGLFAPVNAMNSMLGSITASLQAYLVPKLTAKHAAGRQHVGRLAIRAAMIVMAVQVPLLVVAELVMPWLIETLLPAYRQAIPACRVALVAGFLQSGNTAGTAFTAAKAWRAMYTAVGVSLVIQVVCVFGGPLLFQDRLLGVAWGMVAAGALSLVVTWLLVSRVGSGSAPSPISLGANPS